MVVSVNTTEILTLTSIAFCMLKIVIQRNTEKAWSKDRRTVNRDVGEAGSS